MGTESEDNLENAASQEEELLEMDEEAQRSSSQSVEMNIFDAVRGSDGNPIDPVRLKGKDTFCFSCHKGIDCWNECCHGADITLTPNCILRLSKHFEQTPSEFLKEYTVPAMFGLADLPVAKLKMGGKDGKGACPFMSEDGCSVYEDRPATCRYYPLGVLSVKHKEMPEVNDFHFLVKEPHCCGHKESKEQTVDAYRQDQGLEEYEKVNRGWTDLLMKMASWKGLGGPWGENIDTRKKQMFFMATTDVQTFRRFVFETKFLDTYEIDEEAMEILKHDDQALLLLAFDWLKSIFFNEPTLSMKELVLQSSIAQYREETGAA